MTRRAIIHMSAEILRNILVLPRNIEIVGITRSEKTHCFDIHLLGTSEDAALPEMEELEESIWVTRDEISSDHWRSS